MSKPNSNLKKVREYLSTIDHCCYEKSQKTSTSAKNNIEKKIDSLILEMRKAIKKL